MTSCFCFVSLTLSNSKLCNKSFSSFPDMGLFSIMSHEFVSSTLPFVSSSHQSVSLSHQFASSSHQFVLPSYRLLPSNHGFMLSCHDLRTIVSWRDSSERTIIRWQLKRGLSEKVALSGFHRNVTAYDESGSFPLVYSARGDECGVRLYRNENPVWVHRGGLWWNW